MICLSFLFKFTFTDGYFNKCYRRYVFQILAADSTYQLTYSSCPDLCWIQHDISILTKSQSAPLMNNINIWLENCEISGAWHEGDIWRSSLGRLLAKLHSKLPPWWANDFCHKHLFFPYDITFSIRLSHNRLTTRTRIFMNPLWPSDVIWHGEYFSTLFRVMACCLMAASHYPNQCGFIINDVLRHLLERRFRGSEKDKNPSNKFANNHFNVTTTIKGEWVDIQTKKYNNQCKL